MIHTTPIGSNACISRLYKGKNESQVSTFPDKVRRHLLCFVDSLHLHRLVEVVVLEWEVVILAETLSSLLNVALVDGIVALDEGVAAPSHVLALLRFLAEP